MHLYSCTSWALQKLAFLVLKTPPHAGFLPCNGHLYIDKQARGPSMYGERYWRCLFVRYQPKWVDVTLCFQHFTHRLNTIASAQLLWYSTCVRTCGGCSGTVLHVESTCVSSVLNALDSQTAPHLWLQRNRPIYHALYVHLNSCWTLLYIAFYGSAKSHNKSACLRCEEFLSLHNGIPSGKLVL